MGVKEGYVRNRDREIILTCERSKGQISDGHHLRGRLKIIDTFLNEPRFV